MAGFCESGLPVPLSNFRLTAQDGLSRCLAKFVLACLVTGLPGTVRLSDTSTVKFALLPSPTVLTVLVGLLCLTSGDKNRRGVVGHDFGSFQMPRS